MNWSQFFTSSVGKKIIMALSGLFLVAFLLVHAGLNACIWANDNGHMFNKAAHWMGSNVVPRILEIGLFVLFIIHIIQGLSLEFQNRSKRGKGYAVSLGNRGSKWYSRSMGVLGAIILIFLVFHLIDFWIPSRFGGLEEVTYGADPVVYHNLYAEMAYKFTNYPWLGLIYFAGVVALFWHLMHGVESAFRTLGVTNHRYLVLLKWFGWIFALVICLTFLMMPVSFYLGWLV
ncbi:MAG: succinate dehydrogenase cytochrome b subunit [Niabella sp.]